MAKFKKRTTIRRRYRRFSKIRRHLPKKIPIAGTIGFGLSQFSNLGDGGMHQYGAIGGLIDNIKSGDYARAGRDFLRDESKTLIGYDPVTGQWSIPRGLIVMVASGMVGKLAGRFVNPTLSKLPYIGKKIKL